MKLYLSILLVFISIYVQGQQTQVQAKRGVFTERLSVSGHWLDSISTNLNSDDSTSNNVVATGKAAADFIRSLSGRVMKNQLTAPGVQAGNFWVQGTAVMGNAPDFQQQLIAGLPAQAYVTHTRFGYGLGIQRASTDKGPASIVFFKNNASDFNTLNAVQPGDTIGSVVFSQYPDNKTQIVPVMSMHGLVEKTGPDYLSSGFIFNTTDLDGSYAQRVWLNAEGNLLLGNGSGNPYRLNVAEGKVRFNSLAGGDSMLVVSNNDGVLAALPLGENLRLENGFLHADVGLPGYQYKQYIALLSQTGENAPHANVFENTLGDIVWTRNSPGNYTGTITTGSLSNNKVLHAEASDGAGNVFNARLFATNSSTLTLIIRNGSSTNIDGWSNISIEIRDN